MKTREFRRQTPIVSHSRWLAYASASTATALAGSQSAEGAIHYSGDVHEKFPPGSNKVMSFQLDQRGDLFKFLHFSNFSFGFYSFAGFGIIGGSAAFRGQISDYVSVAKLSFGQSIAAGYFVTGTGTMASGENHAYWSDPGVGFVAFRFNRGAGIQYGWARVRMGGTRRRNGFEVLDYAFADAGEPIFAGQRSSDEQAPDQNSPEEDAPDQGSLGGLALGAAGLFAWRKSQSQAARLKNA
jgi:hypothetical protein